MYRVKEYYKPSSLEEALSLLDCEPDIKILAGGTDLIISLNEWKETPCGLLDIGSLVELKEIQENETEVSLGSMLTFSRIAGSDRMYQLFPALVEAASKVAAPQVRNRATIGGNIANAAVAADSVPALMALDASVVLQSANGIREVPIVEFMLDLNKTVIKDNEILTYIKVKKNREVSAFEKIGRRKAQAISRICVAVAFHQTNQNTIADARVAIGAAGRTAYLCMEAAQIIEGGSLSDQDIEDSARALDEKINTVLGYRSTAPYKRQIAYASLRNALLRLREASL